MNTDKKLSGVSILTAVAASLCCITPVLALFAGTNAIASTFSWLNPFRPYLIALTVLVLGLAWFQKLKPKTEDINCDCDNETPKFITTKKFLFFVTIFTGVMLAFPYYANIFYPDRSVDIIYGDQSNVFEVNYKIRGMTCLGCEEHIKNEVYQLDGIINVEAKYDKATTTVSYDKTLVTSKKIEEAILNTGYKIIY